MKTSKTTSKKNNLTNTSTTTQNKTACYICKKNRNCSLTHSEWGPVSICSKCKTLHCSIQKKNEWSLNTTTNIIPAHIVQQLNKYIIGQESAKIALAVVGYNHLKRVNSKNTSQDIKLPKHNILIIGPSGSGKSTLTTVLGKILQLPFTRYDATALTAPGYIGDSIESILAKTLSTANNNIDLAEKSIIFLDEIDKKSSVYCTETSNTVKDINRTEVQNSMLLLMEGTTVKVPITTQYGNNTIEMSTENNLFIAAGAFNGLSDIIKKRLLKKSIGFGKSQRENTKIKESELLSYVNHADLVEYGLTPEFAYRFEIIVTLEELSPEKYVNLLLNAKNSIVEQYKSTFAMDNIKLLFTDCAIENIAIKSYNLGMGGRGIKFIIDNILLPIMYELPGQHDVQQVTVNKNVVLGMQKPIISYKTSKKTTDFSKEGDM